MAEHTMRTFGKQMNLLACLQNGKLCRRKHTARNMIKKYNHLVQETAKFMYSFATYDEFHGRFILKGAIPAQETLREIGRAHV